MMEPTMNQAKPLRKPDTAQTAVQVGTSRSLGREVMERSGTNLYSCYHCGSCANGCPFIQAMDYPPNVVLRLLQYGMRQEVLQCGTIWICVGCHTCSSQCPMAIDMAAIMETLRHKAVEEGVAIARPDILDFHEDVLQSLERHGRAHKLGIMLRHKVRTRRWFRDMDLGLKLLAKRKLDLRASRIKNTGEIKSLFQCYWRESK
jgi:heterodisulfide reductase subunit C